MYKMNYIGLKNPFLSSANKERYESSMKHLYFDNCDRSSNFVGNRINSDLPKTNSKSPMKPAVNKNTSEKSQGDTEDLKQDESYVAPKNRRPASPDKQRDSSTSSQERGSECERNKTPRKNSKKQKKRLQERTLSTRCKSTKSNIAVKKTSTKFQRESDKTGKICVSKEPNAESKSKKLKDTQDQTVKKGQAVEEFCGEAGKWKYIRMYQERNRRREARRRRQRQKEREEAQRSGRRRSPRRRRKSKKRSKSRSRRKSKGRKSRSRSRTRRRTGSRKSSASRSRRSSRSRSRRGSPTRKRCQG